MNDRTGQMWEWMDDYYIVLGRGAANRSSWTHPVLRLRDGKILKMHESMRVPWDGKWRLA